MLAQYKFYNEEQKNAFIKHYQGDSENNFVRNIFSLTQPNEEYMQKDVCEFTEKEILELLRSFNSSSVNSLRVKMSILRTYATWCEVKGLIRNNMNSFENLFGKDIEGCVNKYAKASKLITYEHLLKIINDLPNPVDQFVLLALFEGISGKSNTKEITSLKIKDLHEDYFDLPTRKIKVTPMLYNIAMEAATTDIYVSLKGKYQEKKLLSCDYVYKPKYNVADTSNLEEDNILRMQRRLLKIREILDQPEMTISSLYYSGMIHYMGIIAKEKGIDILDVLEEPEYEDIKEKYQITSPKFSVKANIKGYLPSE